MDVWLTLWKLIPLSFKFKCSTLLIYGWDCPLERPLWGLIMSIIHETGTTCCQLTDKIQSGGSLCDTSELNWYKLSKSSRCTRLSIQAIKLSYIKKRCTIKSNFLKIIIDSWMDSYKTGEIVQPQCTLCSYPFSKLYTYTYWFEHVDMMRCA